MMLGTVAVSLRAGLVLVAVAATYVRAASIIAPASSHEATCKCVPDQWEGMLLTTDREYDLGSGKSGQAETRLYIHYDYTNKRLAILDLSTGNKAIADYAKGANYVVRAEGCEGRATDQPMRKMCLPDEAELVGEHTIGGDVPVSLWQFHGPFNVSMRTTVMQTTCLSISEEVSMTRGEFVSVSSSMYLDAKPGIKDESVFSPPLDCMLRFREESMRETKRKADPNHLLHAIRNRLYIFH